MLKLVHFFEGTPYFLSRVTPLSCVKSREKSGFFYFFMAMQLFAQGSVTICPHFYQDKIRQIQCATQAITSMSYLQIPLNHIRQHHYYKTRTIVHVWNQSSGNSSGTCSVAYKVPVLHIVQRKLLPDRPEMFAYFGNLEKRRIHANVQILQVKYGDMTFLIFFGGLFPSFRIKEP